jgi:hypothetical protein
VRFGSALTVFVGGILGATMLAGFGGTVLKDSPAAPPFTVAEIPAPYLVAYRAASDAFELGSDGWSYLAAIGKIESDHGRSSASGVHTGQNSHGCCAGPMQIHNGFGAGTGTWGVYKVDGDLDGRTDIYDPDDAAATAANYLRASGAPEDWRAAAYAYNHAHWYVADVVRQAADYRAQAAAPVASQTVGPVAANGWLAPIPGFPGERCDRRIVRDVVHLLRNYRLTLTDCFGGAPHELDGEHPLGLAVDVAPADGDWNRTMRLATDAGWSPACARSGCPGRGPFRVVLYNGYPGHGDPRFASVPHLHLSWQHGEAPPFSPAPWIRTVLTSPVAP